MSTYVIKNKIPKKEKDAVIIDAINSFYEQNYRTPSLSEIARDTGISRQTVQRRLARMNEEGTVKYDGKLKTIITSEIEEREKGDTVQLSILGRIACGSPTEEYECRLGVIDFPRALLGIGDYFMLEASGGSMVNVGIDNGDYVIIKRTCEASIGDIVVAMNGDCETTLKTLQFNEEEMCYYLHPEADGYEDIYPEEIDIIGVATKVIKNL